MIGTRKKGTFLEHKVRDMLRAEGWMVVRQGASAFPDLICLKSITKPFSKENIPGASETRLVECKWNRYLKPAEKEQLRVLREQTGATAMVAYVIKDKNGRRKAIAMEEVK